MLGSQKKPRKPRPAILVLSLALVVAAFAAMTRSRRSSKSDGLFAQVGYRIHDLASGVCVAEVAGVPTGNPQLNNNCFVSIPHTSDILCVYGGVLNVVDLISGKRRDVTTTGTTYSVAVSHDGDLVCAGVKDGRYPHILVLAANEGYMVRRDILIKEHGYPVSLSISPSKNAIVCAISESTGPPGSMILIDVAHGSYRILGSGENPRFLCDECFIFESSGRVLSYDIADAAIRVLSSGFNYSLAPDKRHYFAFLSTEPPVGNIYELSEPYTERARVVKQGIGAFSRGTNLGAFSPAWSGDSERVAFGGDYLSTWPVTWSTWPVTWEINSTNEVYVYDLREHVVRRVYKRRASSHIAGQDVILGLCWLQP